MRNSRVVYFGLAELVSCSSSLLHVRKVRVIQKSCASATEESGKWCSILVDQKPQQQ